MPDPDGQRGRAADFRAGRRGLAHQEFLYGQWPGGELDRFQVRAKVAGDALARPREEPTCT
jgi:hypothetical protein